MPERPVVVQMARWVVFAAYSSGGLDWVQAHQDSPQAHEDSPPAPWVWQRVDRR